MARKKRHLPAILFSRGLFVVLIVILLFVSVSLLREVKRKRNIQTEIKELEHELTQLERDNVSLQSLIDYLKTDEYIELEAKKKLGMKRAGEQVILVTKKEVSATTQTSSSQEAVANWQLWWRYFFE